MAAVATAAAQVAATAAAAAAVAAVVSGSKYVFALSFFHFLLLFHDMFVYSDWLYVFCLFNEVVVYLSCIT